MALSSTERQARYRQKLKDLASSGGIGSPALVDLLAKTRSRLREWSRVLAMLGGGHMRSSRNNVDCTAEQAANFSRMIAENTALLATYDPDNTTHDGNIELGDVSPCQPQEIGAGRFASYELDDQGRAANLRVFNEASQAAADAQANGRHSGEVAADGWSIYRQDDAPLMGDEMFAFLRGVRYGLPVDWNGPHANDAAVRNWVWRPARSLTELGFARLNDEEVARVRCQPGTATG